MVANLMIPEMIVYDVTTKELGTESFPQHNITGLISGITFIFLLRQEKPLQCKKTDTHKHTHTYTHTCTHVYTIKGHVDILFLSEIKLDCFFFF